MNLIAAVDHNWALGNKGKLLVSIPGDHKFFRKMTKDKVVIYGRKTLETFPMKQPLDNRTNIILTRDASLRVKDAMIAHSVDEVLKMVQKYPAEDVFIIGGESVYKEFLPYCDTAYITKIDFSYDADAFLPDLDQDPHWKLVEESDEQTYFSLAYTFATYKRICTSAADS